MAENPEAVTVEESDEANYLVVDPDDYQKTKKLESIHKTKQEVLKVRRNRHDLIQEYHDAYNRKGQKSYQVKLGKTIAQYGSELLPLIEDAIEKGTLSEDDLIVSLSEDRLDMDIREFITFDGQYKYNGEYQTLPEPNLIAVYRQLDRIQRKLGLGLEIEEQTEPGQIEDMDL